MAGFVAEMPFGSPRSRDWLNSPELRHRDLSEVFDCIILVSYRKGKSPGWLGRMSRSIWRAQLGLPNCIGFETPKWMGIDEIHLIKPRCVISNIRNNTIVNMLPNRDKKTVGCKCSILAISQ
jgi:hypothetical protein